MGIGGRRERVGVSPLPSHVIFTSHIISFSNDRLANSPSFILYTPSSPKRLCDMFSSLNVLVQG